MSKKISIITVCYNAPNTEKTCKSIVNQTFQDFEWIVIDGGSNKETLDIFDKYKSRMDYFVSEKDNGIYNAMNKGIKQATGDYLLFMNAGDSLYDKNVLKKFVSAKLDADIIYANEQITGTDKVQVYPDVLDKDFWILWALPHQATLIKRTLFKRYGGYDENYKIVSDHAKFIEFIMEHNCSYKHVNFIGCYFDLSGVSNVNQNLSLSERKIVLKKFFTSAHILAIYRREFNKQLSFIEKIFSITYSFDHEYKVVTILGFHIKFKRKNK